MFENIDTVLFDLDGTILDSMSVWEDIDKEFFEKNHFDIDYRIVKKDIEGSSMYETAQYFIKNFNINKSPEALVEEWNQMAFEHYSRLVGEKPGVTKFIRRLKEKGYKLGVASSNSYTLISAGLENLGLKDCFDVIVTSNEVNKGKPAPDVYLEAAKRINSEPAKCFVFEDVSAGVQAGISAGMKTCVIYDEYSKADWDEKVKLADFSIKDYYGIIGEVNE